MESSSPDPEVVPPSCRFRETALASGLLQPEQVEAAEAEVRFTLDPAADPAAWGRAVADRLVEQGLLTRFQAREMLAGRRRFRLGQYTVLDEIGRGGMGQVFRAEHAMMGRQVALKVLPRAKSTPEYEAAFKREIRMLAGLDHENLVRALDAGHDAKVYYLVTELVPGLDLRRQVLKHGPLEPAAAASVISQAARGLGYAHEQGLVHRDVKPGNLLVTPEGRVKVLDLGLAGSMLEPVSTSTGRVVGTMDYMAPEQIRSPDAVGPAADIYALGCTLYFTLSGQVPFPGGSRKEKAQRQLNEAPVPLAQVAPHVDPDLRRVVEAMMTKAAAERVGTAAEVLHRLEPWLPRALVPMPRQRATGRDGQPGVRGLPPPVPAGGDSLPAEPSSASPRSAGPSSGAGGIVPPPWPAAPPAETFAGDGGAGAWNRLVQCAAAFRPSVWLRPVGIAAAAAITFGLVMWLIRGIDARRFDEGLRGVSPTLLGLLAFLLLLAVQRTALLGERRGE